MRSLTCFMFLFSILGSGCGSDKGGEETMPFGTADCRVECESLTDTMVQIWRTENRSEQIQDIESREAAYREQCQEMPNGTTCEECIYRITVFLIEEMQLATDFVPDCACYFEQIRPTKTGTYESEWCDEILDAYGGRAQMADECQTCWTDQ